MLSKNWKTFLVVLIVVAIILAVFLRVSNLGEWLQGNVSFLNFGFKANISSGGFQDFGIGRVGIGSGGGNY